MEIDLVDNLLHTTLTITHQQKKIAIDRLVIDTGAAHTLISSDAVYELNIFDMDGEIVTMYGIGGGDQSYRTRIDLVQFGTFTAEDYYLDFGYLDEDYGINGIIGLDILLSGKFVIDLANMEIFQK